MPALVAGTHIFLAFGKTWMGGPSRAKPGHDGEMTRSERGSAD
jgi:hypothetical protein